MLTQDAPSLTDTHEIGLVVHTVSVATALAPAPQIAVAVRRTMASIIICQPLLVTSHRPYGKDETTIGW